MSPREEEEFQALDKRKYPYGRGGASKGPGPGDKDLSGGEGLVGTKYEDYLVDNLPNSSPSFSEGGREFDGSYDNGKTWFEAKSGRYWEKQVESDAGFAKFKSDMGQRQQLARSKGADYVLFSNTPIPNKVKDYLDKKGIKYYETSNPN